MVFFPPFFLTRASVKGGMSSTPAAGPGAASAYANPPASPKRPAPGAAAYPPLPTTSAPAPATFPSPIVFVLRFFFTPRTSPPRFFPALFPPLVAFAGDAGGASRPSFPHHPARRLALLVRPLLRLDGIERDSLRAKLRLRRLHLGVRLLDARKVGRAGFLGGFLPEHFARLGVVRARRGFGGVKGADVLRHAADAVDRLVLGLETLLGFGTRAHALVPRLVHAQHGEAHAALASGDGEQLTAGSALGALDVALGNSRELRRGHLLRRGCAAGAPPAGAGRLNMPESPKRTSAAASYIRAGRAPWWEACRGRLAAGRE